ncbi:MAG: Unknown protein [uncultured Sulfurovum sp.]|uniref:beta-lactamase n=1 Tax=uncultured Sulfurovum sp. TaxID=269237 RepID=A0A6S6TZ85_9BACT|nr:MAG: Unknown protein [uncultured Sulfurovum sp.]
MIEAKGNKIMKSLIWLILITINLSGNDFKKHEITCDNNVSSGCRERAYLALEVNKDSDEAEEYFLKACELQDPKSCSFLGYMYRSKNVNKKDEKRYFKFFYKACQLGNPESCMFVGSLYSKTNPIQATRHYQKACELGNQRGCERLGRNYFSGYGIKKDRKQGINLFKKNCQLNHNGCLWYVGFIGIGEEYKDLNISEFKLLKYNCSLNNDLSCNDLGFLSLEVYQDYTKAENYFKKACQLQNQESCKMLGFIYKNKHTEKKDQKKSFYYFNKACELANPYACQYAGLMYWRGEGVQKDWGMSAQLYKRSCDLGNSVGCRFLGSSYYLGQGVTLDKVKAIQLYKQACNDGEHYGCMKYIYFSAQK